MNRTFYSRDRTSVEWFHLVHDIFTTLIPLEWKSSHNDYFEAADCTSGGLYNLVDWLQWRHNGCDCVSNHQPHDCLLKRLFRRRSKKTSKLRATGPCAGNSPVTGEFPAQMASNAENASIFRRHHGLIGFIVVWGSETPYTTNNHLKCSQWPQSSRPDYFSVPVTLSDSSEVTT